MDFNKLKEDLEGFDINDVDWKNAGSWPALGKAISAVLVVAVVLGGGFYLMIKDQITQLDRVAAEEVQLKKDYENKAFRVANIEAFKLQMVEMEASFGALLRQLPRDTEVPGLLEDITQTARSSGLEISSIKLEPETATEFYTELPISIQVNGGYHELGAFVSGVASLPRIVTLHNFSIERASEGSRELNMAITAKTYRYSDEEE
jgi:type IV pilus assembly protein PilO